MLDYKERSRSPRRSSDHKQSSKRRRSTSSSPAPDRRQRHHHHHKRERSSRSAHPTETDIVRPYNARTIHKHELPVYRPMFALYLDIQKQLDIEELGAEEVRGRWKSFVGKWNRGELAEGWYDPETYLKAKAAADAEAEGEAEAYSTLTVNNSRSPRTETVEDVGLRGHAHSTEQSRDRVNDEKMGDVKDEDEDKDRDEDDDDDDDDDGFGPALPFMSTTQSVSQLGAFNQQQEGPIKNQGPSIPTINDLRALADQAHQDHIQNLHLSRLQARQSQREDQLLQKARLDELVPRADPGTRARQLENKRIKSTANRAFASSAHDTGPIDNLPDSALMGTDDQSDLTALKTQAKEQVRKKNERELKREEILRARLAEREVRMRGIREKEQKTVDMLKKLAQARFGP